MEYKIGAGKAQIIITEDMFPYGFGRGAKFTGIHDELFVRALIMEKEAYRILIVTADLDSIGYIDSWKNLICGIIDVPRDHIFFMATHNHESIHVRNDKDDKPEGDADTIRSEQLVWDAMKRAIEGALRTLRPGKIRFGTGTCDININREFQYLGYYMIGRNPHGPSDKTVAVLYFTDLNDKPIAVFVNYAVHGSVMAEMEGPDHEILISGDIPGYTSRYIEESYGGDVVALWTSGAAGNQDAKYRATRYAFDTNGVLHRYHVGDAGYVLCDMQARDLAEEVVRIVPNTMVVTGDLHCVQTARCVPGKQGPHGPRPDMDQKPGERSLMPDMDEVRPDGLVMKDMEINLADGDPVTVRVGLVVIGDTVLVCFSGELTYALGQMAKKNLEKRFKNVVIVTHCNGYIGYMSDEDGFDRRVRSALSTNVARGQAEKLVIDIPWELATERLK